MNKFRDELGLIQLDNLEIRNKQKINNYVISFEYNGNKYFFKRVKNVHNIYNELISYEIGNRIGLNVIPNDIASLDGMIGYLSKNYMRDEYIYLEELLNKVYKSSEGKCNVDDIVFAFMMEYGDLSSSKVLTQLIDLIEFDIIIANHDRHDRNILIDVKNKCLGPITDNEMMLSDEGLYEHYYSLSLNGKQEEQLESFINILNENQLIDFKNKIDIISKDNIEKIIESVEDKLGTKMEETIKNDIIKKFNINYNYLFKLLNKSKKKDKQKVLKKNPNNKDLGISSTLKEN